MGADGLLSGAGGPDGGSRRWLGSQTLTTEFGRRIGRDMIIYALAGVSVLLVSLVMLVVYTHYLPPAQYGKLAILFFTSALLTVVLNLIPLAGILRWVYVAGEAAVGAVDDPNRQAPGGTKRRALGTGCWMNAAFIAIGAGVLVPLAHPLARLLVGRSSGSGWVLLAIASGAAGSLFRLTSNVVRMERRPVAFSLILAARGFVTVAVATPLVVAGDGINGALLGTLAGSLLPGIAAVLVSRESYSAEFSWYDFRQITDLGAKYIFVILGLFVVHNGDPFVLSRFASDAEVGIYRVATRLSSIISYLVSAFLLAWAPMERSTLFQATYQRYGRAQVHKKLVTYYVVAGLTVMVGLSLGGDVLVRLSPPKYWGAANLIPFTSFAFLIYGLFVVVARTTHHRHRDFVHNASAALGAILYVAIAAALVPRWGGYGLAVSATVGMGAACAWFRAINRTASHHAPFDWPRVTAAAVIAVGCVALGDARAVGHGALRAALLLLDFLVLYPALLLALGVVPWEEAKAIYPTLRSLVGLLLAPLRRGGRDEATIRALATLAPDDLVLLRRLTKDRQRSSEVAASAAMPVSVVEARAARMLRELTGAPGSERDDAAIGNWLFSGKTVAEQDVVRHYLERYGVDIMTLQPVEEAAAAARALPQRAWPEPGRARPDDGLDQLALS